MPRNVLLVLDELVANRLLSVGGARTQSGHAVDDIGDQVKPIEVVQHDHVEGSGRRALFLVAAHVQVVMIRAAIGQPMDEQRIPVIGKDDRLVGREEHVELLVAQAVRMLALWLELHEIHDVDDPDLQLRDVRPKE